MKEKIRLIAIITILVITITPSKAQTETPNINIGSTKEDVRLILGYPISVDKFDALNIETWEYEKNGTASITFKNGVIYEYNNRDGILPVGDINKKGTKHHVTKSKKSVDGKGDINESKPSFSEKVTEEQIEMKDKELTSSMEKSGFIENPDGTLTFDFSKAKKRGSTKNNTLHINPVTGRKYYDTNTIGVILRDKPLTVDPIQQKEFEKLGLNPSQEIRGSYGDIILKNEKRRKFMQRVWIVGISILCLLFIGFAIYRWKR